MSHLDDEVNEAEIFVPTPDDADPEAEAQMQQGREDLDPENALYDPWFQNADRAQAWRPGDPDPGDAAEGGTS